MGNKILMEVKKVVVNSVGTGVPPDSLTEGFPIVGNILDSMAITNLILSLEEHFGFFSMLMNCLRKYLKLWRYNLVMDMRSLEIIKAFNAPTVFDATP